jgi:hypothetical protein
VIVHEWGTFTSLQDEHGRAIGGINVDDEPVPGFVYGVGGAEVEAQYSPEFQNFGLPPYSIQKGWMGGDPAVTLRLETPVLYIYPPKGQAPKSVPSLDVHVDFHGGILSQYYPYAQTSGLTLNSAMPYVKDGLTGTTTTGLTWKGVRLDSSGTPIAIDDKVWTTPREVSASWLAVSAPDRDGQGATNALSQTERFLFYRGVGHLDSPLRISDGFKGLVGTSTTFQIEAQREVPGAGPRGAARVNYGHSWLVQIRSDGSCAFHALEPFAGSQAGLFSGPAARALSFYDEDFSSANLDRLKTSMQAALVQEGLYPDEASAMLRTWELSYFKSPGLRFFYTVPRVWVDQVLPLTVTGVPAKITRVMVGRIELVTDVQRAALKRLAAGPCPDLPAFKNAAGAALRSGRFSPADTAAFYRGEKPLGQLGIPMPPLIADYLSLGRFRDALVVDEDGKRPTPALDRFVRENRLTPGVEATSAQSTADAGPAEKQF